MAGRSGAEEDGTQCTSKNGFNRILGHEARGQGGEVRRRGGDNVLEKVYTQTFLMPSIEPGGCTVTKRKGRHTRWGNRPFVIKMRGVQKIQLTAAAQEKPGTEQAE
ncbi:MAG: hypothetical protein ABGZ19_08300 [Verrucomicrobiales bacterium]